MEQRKSMLDNCCHLSNKYDRLNSYSQVVHRSTIAVTVAAPHAQNSLPDSLHKLLSLNNLKKHLKSTYSKISVVQHDTFDAKHFRGSLCCLHYCISCLLNFAYFEQLIKQWHRAVCMHIAVFRVNLCLMLNSSIVSWFKCLTGHWMSATQNQDSKGHIGTELRVTVSCSMLPYWWSFH